MSTTATRADWCRALFSDSPNNHQVALIMVQTGTIRPSGVMLYRAIDYPKVINESIAHWKEHKSIADALQQIVNDLHRLLTPAHGFYIYAKSLIGMALVTIERYEYNPETSNGKSQVMLYRINH